MTDETRALLEQQMEKDVREWVRARFLTTVLNELISANTEVAYMLHDIDESERAEVRKLARKVIRRVLVDEIAQLGSPTAR